MLSIEKGSSGVLISVMGTVSFALAVGMVLLLISTIVSAVQTRAQDSANQEFVSRVYVDGDNTDTIVYYNDGSIEMVEASNKTGTYCISSYDDIPDTPHITFVPADRDDNQCTYNASGDYPVYKEQP